jgi:hypothetical protein
MARKVRSGRSTKFPVSLSHAGSSTRSNPEARKSEQIPTPREINFLRLPTGALIDVIADPINPDRTRLAISENGQVRFVDKFEHEGEILVPMPRSVRGFAHVRLPTGVLPYDSIEDLYFTVSSFLLTALDLPALHATIVAAFVLYDWVADCLPVAVYLSVVGLPQSGKTTLLDLLSLLCRRPLLVSDLSDSALSHACTRFSPTFLIDEIDWSSSSTARALRRHLRAGTGSSSTILRLNESTVSFGPKVLCSLEPTTDAALRSRCIQIVMSETRRADLRKPNHPGMLKVACELQQKLLQFRFDSYSSIRAASIPGDENLRPRSQDILRALAAPAGGGFEQLRKGLLGYVKLHHDEQSRDGLEIPQDAVLAVLFQVLHENPEVNYIRVKMIASAANSRLRADKAAVSDKGVGRILASLGLRNTKRTKQGWVLSMDSETHDRLHQLSETHGISHLAEAELESYARTCDACRKK